MRIKSIVIEMELEGSEQQSGHATEFKWINGLWHMNGPVFPRFGAALNEITKLLKGER